MRRRCVGIIFDLDDTLVQTSKIDRAAIRHAVTLALESSSSVDLYKSSSSAVQLVESRFADLLKSEPFPPAEIQIDIASWRTGLWTRALSPDVDDASVKPVAKLAHDAWSANRLDNFKFEDEVAKLIKRLQANGYLTGVLTNGHKDVQRTKTNACGAAALFGNAQPQYLQNWSCWRLLLEVFSSVRVPFVCIGEDKVVIAGEYPEQKPHPSIFDVACKAVGAAHNNCIMVGDSYKADIAGGINAGLLATVWVRPQAEGSMAHDIVTEVPTGQPPPTHTVRSVLELEAVLEKIG